jgi:hypothetical protein
MDDEEMANMQRLLTLINADITSNLEAGFEDDSDRDFLEQPRPDALECVIGACIDESVKSFRRDGMAFECLDVIVNGRADYFGWVPSCPDYQVEEKWLNFVTDVVLW